MSRRRTRRVGVAAVVTLAVVAALATCSVGGTGADVSVRSTEGQSPAAVGPVATPDPPAPAEAPFVDTMVDSTPAAKVDLDWQPIGTNGRAAETYYPDVVGKDYAVLRDDVGGVVRSPRAVKVVRLSDGAVTARHAVSDMDSAIIYVAFVNGYVLVVERGVQQQAARPRLVRITPATGEVNQVEPSPATTFSTILLFAEWRGRLIAGTDRDGYRERCLVEIDVTTGRSSDLHCATGDGGIPFIRSSPDGLTWMEVHGPDPSIAGCKRVMRMTPDGAVDEIAGGIGECLKYDAVRLGEWDVYSIVSKSNNENHRFQWSTFYAVTKDRTIRLGIGSINTAVACGKHVYWLSHPYDAGDHDSGKPPARGREILRWAPGTNTVESVYTEQMPDDPNQYAGYVFQPLCTNGVLTAGAKYFTPNKPEWEKTFYLPNP